MKLNKCFKLFLTFFKIGLFTFGGGYAMISLMENEFVEQKKWISHDEFMDLLVVAESTPGPIAINSATYIGYKIAGVFGSVFATIGVCLPSFIIIYIISLFFDAFLKFRFVESAFKGIQIGVVYLIFSAGYKMFKKMEKKAFSIILFSLTAIAMLLFSLFAVKFSSIFYILFGAVVSLVVYLIKNVCEKEKNK